jgi:group I intron endonuclease
MNYLYIPKLKCLDNIYLGMNKYTIYQIIHKQFPHCYIGCTKDLNRRIAVHKTYCNQQKSRYLYDKMNLNGGWDAYDVVILEEFVCMSRTDAETRENYWIKKMESDMMIMNTYKCNMGSVPIGCKNPYYYKHRQEKQLESRLNYYKKIANSFAPGAN